MTIQLFEDRNILLRYSISQQNVPWCRPIDRFKGRANVREHGDLCEVERCSNIFWRMNISWTHPRPAWNPAVSCVVHLCFKHVRKITVIRRDSKKQFITIKPSSHTSAWPWNELTRFNRNQRRGPKSEGRKMHIGLWQSCFFTSFNQLISPCEYCVQACTQHSKCDLTTIEYKGRTLVIPEEILFAWILFAALLRLSGGLGVFWNC